MFEEMSKNELMQIDGGGIGTVVKEFVVDVVVSVAAEAIVSAGKAVYEYFTSDK